MRWTFFAALALSAPVGASAQAVPNFSGTWALQVDKSDFGMMGGPTSRTDVIDHQEPKLTIKRTITGPNGEITSNLVYAVDGKPYKNTVANAETTSTLSWDGQTLVMVTLYPSPQGEATITDRYTLSADGKTLTQDRSVAIQGQNLAQKMVLTRQP